MDEYTGLRERALRWIAAQPNLVTVREVATGIEVPYTSVSPLVSRLTLTAKVLQVDKTQLIYRYRLMPGLTLTEALRQAAGVERTSRRVERRRPRKPPSKYGPVVIPRILELRGAPRVADQGRLLRHLVWESRECDG